MRIPKSFKLFGTTVHVVFDDERMNNESIVGESDFAKSLISLTESYKGDLLTEDVIADTYYHEKVHMILDSMKEHELSKNEKFVEVFSKLLRQSDETAEL